jgi:hypothetical protein
MGVEAVKRVTNLAALAVMVVAMGGAMKAEPVPEATVVGGVPRGMFVSRSLLTGRTVCLMFLSNGRVTRAVPDGGLENFDWAKHLAEHPRDSGRWEARGNQLAIVWGDGGVHEGPLAVRPDGIEFYGKRYTKPVGVSLEALVGRWQATRGTAIAGGSGVNIASTLIIHADGRYEWSSTTGGVVAGRAAASGTARTGTAKVTGFTIVLTPNSGAVTSHTLLAVAGSPITAFSLDANMFTRTP